MNKFLISILLLLLSNCAMAEWVKVVETNRDSPTTAYLDPDTVSKRGFKVSIWTLLDFSSSQSYEKLDYHSMKSQQEYDCKNKKMRILETSFYSGNMASGNIIFHTSATLGSAPVSPGTMIEDLWEHACGIRIKPHTSHSADSETSD